MLKKRVMQVAVGLALLLSLLGGSGLGSGAAQVSIASVHPYPLCGGAAPPCI